ncbi:hypothetical protein LTR95_004433 [Oleoguttula sp. CCFEE 5521]
MSGKMPDSRDGEEGAATQSELPSLIVQQAAEAATGAQADDSSDRRAGRDVPVHTDTLSTVSSEHDVPPPAYGEVYGTIQENQADFGTKATVADDGRINININQRTRKLSNLLVPALREQQFLASEEKAPPNPYIPPNLGGDRGELPPPPMNVVIHVVGSRGDVQPFVALGKVLKDTYGHRVRLATHPVFKDFVNENGLEFFSIGGDPAELMAFMVKNPGLMPGFDTIRSGDVGNRRKEIGTMIKGCWRSCFEAGDGMGPAATTEALEHWTPDTGDYSAIPFIADAIIANPPSFAHIHCAEKLGVPLHIMFTMPYCPTQAFPHPLANIQSTNADPSVTNYLTYGLVEALTWQGLGDIINRFRTRTLGLDEVSLIWAPSMLNRLKVPHTYCWSPALIPKPKDWGAHITISGFFFLNLATDYTPAADLQAFLDAGPPPVYIGFGSIVLDDPNAMTKTLFEAVKKSGQRALVSKGWGGMGADELGKPDNVFMLGNVPHDWLFKHVSCVVHHGGAGTTAAGITAGKPTLVVPFFGDQPFWGAMVARAGAGPDPIPAKQLTADKLAEGIKFCLKPSSQDRAHDLAAKIAQEKGSDLGAQYFHQFVDLEHQRCSVSPGRVAVWRLKRTQIRLSAMAACTLSNAGLLKFSELKLYRAREYETDLGPTDPISGATTALVGTASSMMMGVADFPIATLKALHIHPDASKKKKTDGEAGDTETEPASRKTSLDEKSDKLSTMSSRSSVTSPTMKGSSPDPTPSTSRSGSSFNLQESLSKIQSPTQQPGRSMSIALKDNLRRRSQSPSSRTGSSKRSDSPSRDPRKMLETAMDTGKGVQAIIGAGFKSPMEFTMGLSKGFRNAPKLYGDDTVRKPEHVTDFRSGMRAATKEFGLGVYDGISGLVTQPVRGAQKEGAAGFLKGIGKGIGGVVLKTSAGGMAIPAYTMKGIYKEMQSHFGSSIQNYIIAARTAQGVEDWTNASSEEKAEVVKNWQALQVGLKKKKNLDEIMHDICQEHRRKRQAWAHKRMEGWRSHHGSHSGQDGDSVTSSTNVSRTATHVSTASTTTAGDHSPAEPEIEDAIMQSVRETSRGDPEEDAAVERAIRASMAELTKSQNKGNDFADEDSELMRAMAASMSQGGTGDEELERALAASLREQRGISDDASDLTSVHGVNSVRDDETLFGDNEVGGISMHDNEPTDEKLPPYDAGHLAGATKSAFEKSGGGEKSREELDEEETVMKYVKKQSQLEQQHKSAWEGKSSASGAGPTAERVHDEDEELKKAMELSLKESGSSK